MTARRILALQMKRIGDLILTAPALASLRHHFPEAEIELVVDAVVPPDALREEIVRRFAAAEGRRDAPVRKVHGVPPM